MRDHLGEDAGGGLQVGEGFEQRHDVEDGAVAVGERVVCQAVHVGEVVGGLRERDDVASGGAKSVGALDVRDGAEDLARVEYRPFCFETFGSRETTARLRGMRSEGEVRLLFSREDMTHALLDQPRWAVNGYTPDSARRLMANIVRYAIHLRGEQ